MAFYQKQIKAVKDSMVVSNDKHVALSLWGNNLGAYFSQKES